MDSKKVIKKLDELRLLRGSLRRRLETQNPVGLYVYKNENANIRDISEKFSVEQIAKSARWSFIYALNVLNKKPFELGEPAIAKSAGYSYLYANQVLHKPFKLGEPAIAKDAEYSCMYAYYVLHKNRFKLGEPAIAMDAHYSYEYAYSILNKKPFKLGEPEIAKSAYYSYKYASNVLHLPESEAKNWGKDYVQ